MSLGDSLDFGVTAEAGVQRSRLRRGFGGEQVRNRVPISDWPAARRPFFVPRRKR